MHALGRDAVNMGRAKKPQAAIMVDVLGIANASSQKNLSTIYKKQYVSSFEETF